MRPPLTIWRYTLIELWRLVVLTTAVLVVVIVFAAAVRYTAAGKLGPLETLRFMGLAMVPMLQYALPFAAGFGATLAYHRMAQDNELKAAAASGVSHRSLLGPALISGILLTGLLSLLTAQIIPGFLRDMQRMVTQDVTKMVVGSIRSGQALDFNGRMIHADSVRELGPDPDGRFNQMLLLTGVTGLEVDDSGQVVKEVTAKQALIGFSHGGAAMAAGDADGSSGMLVTLVLKNWTGWERGKGQASGESTEPYSVPMPGGLDDDPKFFTSSELGRLPANPDRLNIISSRAQELAYRMAERQCTATIDAALRASGQVRMLDQEGRTYEIRASGMQWNHDRQRWELLPTGPGQPFVVEVSGDPNAPGVRPFVAKNAGLTSDIGSDAWSRRLTLNLEMDDVRSFAGEEAAGEWTQLRRGTLVPVDNPLPALLDMTSAELLAKVHADEAMSRDEFVLRPARELEKRIAKLEREIISKRHERAAISVSCMVMVLAGALTAMRLAGSLPLTVYLWSFFPALVAVITISAGQQTTHQIGAGGLFILWGGVALLVGYVAVAFWVVRRH